MESPKNTSSIVDEYFQSLEAKSILSGVESKRQEAKKSRSGFYKKYRRALLLGYVLSIVFRKYFGQYIENSALIFLVGPGVLYWYLGRKKQSDFIASNKLSTKLFNNFIGFVFAESQFDEGKKLYDQDTNVSKLFMEDYDEKICKNSILIPFLKNNSTYDAEIQGVEVCYFYDQSVSDTREGIDAGFMYDMIVGNEGIDNKNIIKDMGLLYRIILHNPKRTIKKELLIKLNNDDRLSTDSDLVKLEDVEFENYFDVQSEDPVEARMILTSNVMQNLVYFIKQSSSGYSFRFIGNNFYIKRKLDQSFIDVDRNISLQQNKQAYVRFYDEINQINKLIEVLNIDYYSRAS